MRRILTLLCTTCVAALSAVSPAVAATDVPSPELKLTPNFVTFGSVPVDGAAYKPVTILNRTKDTLYYYGAAWPNLEHPGVPYPYGIWNASEPFPCWEIAPKSSCTLDFRFVPAEPGPFSSSFTMTYTDGTSNYNSNTILMRGMGR